MTEWAIVLLMLHAVTHAHTYKWPTCNSEASAVGYGVIYRWRHTHPFNESIKMLNITEPHDQLLHLTFLFRMLSSLCMDLTPGLFHFTACNYVQVYFLFCTAEHSWFSFVRDSLTPVSKWRRFSVNLHMWKAAVYCPIPRISSTLILSISCCHRPLRTDAPVSQLRLPYNKVMIKSLNVRSEVIIYPSESAYAPNGSIDN